MRSRISTLSALAAAVAAGMSARLSNRVYGDRAIGRAITMSKKAKVYGASAFRHLPHQGNREIERRLRQAARNEERQRARAAKLFYNPGIDRLSRRGRAVA
jgi:hypothetical protein